MKKYFLLGVIGIAVLVLLQTRVATSAEPIPVQVEAKVKNAYSPGLPVVVEIEVTNVSTQAVESLIPSVKLSSISAGLKKEGEEKYLPVTSHVSYVIGAQKTIQLKPGDKVTGKIDLSMMFQDDLPVGRYVCEAFYAYGTQLRGAQLIRAKAVPVVIEEPSDPSDEEQREMRLVMTQFLAARILLQENNETSRDLAHRLFSYIAGFRRDLEYGKVSAYYKALLEKKPDVALTAWLDYQNNPAIDLPWLAGPDDVLLSISRRYYEIGNLQAAKENLLKIADPDMAVRHLLQKVEDASKLKEAR